MVFISTIYPISRELWKHHEFLGFQYVFRPNRQRQKKKNCKFRLHFRNSVQEVSFLNCVFLMNRNWGTFCYIKKRNVPQIYGKVELLSEFTITLNFEPFVSVLVHSYNAVLSITFDIFDTSSRWLQMRLSFTEKCVNWTWKCVNWWRKCVNCFLKGVIS